MNHSKPQITWRLKLLQLRHEQFSKLESQYPEEMLIPSTKYKIDDTSLSTAYLFKSSRYSTAFSLTSSSSTSNHSSSTHKLKGITSVKSFSLNGDSFKQSVFAGNYSSNEKIHLKYRGSGTNHNDDDGILPTA